MWRWGVKRRKRLTFVSLLAPLLLIVLAEVVTVTASSGRVHEAVGDVESAPVGLVLGTGKYVGDRVNLYYHYRVEAAAQLYHAGRVRGLIISGDNSRKDYNEPQEFKDDLVKKGVPAEHVTLDYAGFRTLDSIIRCKKVFAQERVTVVSQRFHCERAIMMARAHGLEAQGYAAPSPSIRYGWKVCVRECLARVAALADVYVLNRGPKFLGPIEKVGLREG
jgi:SanA protein